MNNYYDRIEIFRISIWSLEMINIKTITIPVGSSLPENISFKDYSVEMGSEYQYIAVYIGGLRGEIIELFQDTPLETLRGMEPFILTTPLLPYGRDNPGYGRLNRMDSAFLTTQAHQLRFQGNVEVGSFQRNVSENFQSTLGSQYPYYSRIGEENYRSLSISSVISVNFDPTSLFFNLVQNKDKRGRNYDVSTDATLPSTFLSFFLSQTKIDEDQILTSTTMNRPAGTLDFSRKPEDIDNNTTNIAFHSGPGATLDIDPFGGWESYDEWAHEPLTDYSYKVAKAKAWIGKMEEGVYPVININRSVNTVIQPGEFLYFIFDKDDRETTLVFEATSSFSLKNLYQFQCSQSAEWSWDYFFYFIKSYGVYTDYEPWELKEFEEWYIQNYYSDIEKPAEGKEEQTSTPFDGYADGLYWKDENGIEVIATNNDLYNDEEISLSHKRVKSYLEEVPSLVKYSDAFPEQQSGPPTIYGNFLFKSNITQITNEKTDFMVYLERKFRDKVMDWLSDGKPKLFRSETEGNMIVMITNPVFTPLEGAGRMVYSLSAELIEIAKYNQENLLLYGLLGSDIYCDYTYNKDDLIESSPDYKVMNRLGYKYSSKYNIPEMTIPSAFGPWDGGKIRIDTRPAVINGVPPYLFYSQNMPKGFHIDSHTGVISGTPLQETSFPSRVRLQVFDSTGKMAQMAIKAGPFYAPLWIFPTTITIPKWELYQEPGFDWPRKFKFSGGKGPYSVLSTDLPPGIKVGISSEAMEVSISGVPTAIGSPASEITVMDSFGEVITAKVEWEGFIEPPYYFGREPHIPLMEVGQAITPITIKDISGVAPFSFSVFGLPTGLSISSTGTIQGTPSVVRGEGAAIVTITDANGLAIEITVTFERVLPQYKFKSSAPNTLPTLTLNEELAPIDFSDYIEGGLPNTEAPLYTFSGSNLEPNYKINEFGILTGKAIYPGRVTTGTIFARDARGKIITKTITLPAIDSGTGGIKTPAAAYSLPKIVVNNKTGISGYGLTISGVTGGTAPYRYVLSGFPEGVSIDTNTGVVSGIPKVATDGPRIGQIKVYDSAETPKKAIIYVSIGRVVPEFNWEGSQIHIPSYLTGEEIVPVYIGSAAGGEPPYTITQKTGSLGPLVLSYSSNKIDSSAQIGGTAGSPAAAREVTLLAQDSLGQEAEKTVVLGAWWATLSLNPINSMAGIVLRKGLSIIDDSLGEGGGNPIRILQAVGGDGNYTFKNLVGGPIVSDLVMSDDGTLIGTPQEKIDQEENHAEKFVVNDGYGLTGSITNPSTSKWVSPIVKDRLRRWNHEMIDSPVIIPKLYVNEFFQTYNYIANGDDNSIWSMGPLPNGFYESELFPHVIEGSYTAPANEHHTWIQCKNPGNIYTKEETLRVNITFLGAVQPLEFTVDSSVFVPALEKGIEIEPILVSEGLSGGVAPYLWFSEGLPPGLYVKGSGENNEIAHIVGVPLQNITPGSVNITVQDNHHPPSQITRSIVQKGTFNPFVFTPLKGYNIPPTDHYTEITPINIVSVSGGVPPYRFSSADTGLLPFTVTPEGVIRGNSGYYSHPHRTGTIQCTDSIGQVAEIKIEVGKTQGSFFYERIPLEFEPPKKVWVKQDALSAADTIFIESDELTPCDDWGILFPTNYTTGTQEGFNLFEDEIVDVIIGGERGGELAE